MTADIELHPEDDLGEALPDDEGTVTVPPDTDGEDDEGDGA